MKKLLFISILVLVSLFQVSCSTEAITNQVATINPVDVYVAGSKNGQACYWKNNQLVMLDSGTLLETLANKIIVSNGDVYVLGKGGNAIITYSLLWKNGVLTNLTQSLTTSSEEVRLINDFDVVGNAVYIVGYTYNTIINKFHLSYWKNGQLNLVSELTDQNNSYTYIKVVNNTIYVTGNYETTTIHTVGLYINNVYQNPSVWPYGLTVKNNEVYIYGNIGGQYKYKNITTGDIITNLSSNEEIKKLVFDNNDTYFSGQNYISGSYNLIKNGNIVFNSDPNLYTSITDFSALNGNLYVIKDLDLVSRLEINNVNAFEIDTNQGVLNGVFVVQN